MKPRPNHWMADAGLMTARLIAGGAFLLAGVIKIQDPNKFMLSVKSFGLVPETLIPYMAYALPWTELIVGLMLIYGLWTRASAWLCGAIYTIFLVALLYVLLGGKDVDCGCFGALFGSGKVGWNSIVRNLVLISAALVPALLGPGRLSLDFLRGDEVPGEAERAEPEGAPPIPVRR
ncbi:MAG: DoxX family protein [Sumerlaeia bacterium]